MPKGAWAQSSPVTVGDQGFSTIQDAIDEIVYGGLYDATLTLHQDFTLEGDIGCIDIYFMAYSEDFNFTIDLNGHTITGGCEWNSNDIYFRNDGSRLLTVTIANSCQDKKGKLFNCRLYLNPNTKVIVNEGVSIYPSFELLDFALYVVHIENETSSVENYGDIYGGVMVGPGGSFINYGRMSYVNGEFENNGSRCAYFNWADDGSSFRVFVYDGSFWDYDEWDESTSITSEVTKEPTCTEPGVRTFTGTFFFGGQEFTDTKEVEIPACHDYQVQNVGWSVDYTSATLQLVCSRDAEHTANVAVTDEGITSEDTTPATCTTAGVRTYTATATYEGEEYTGTKEVEISALGHQFDENHICTVCHQPAEIAHTGTSGTCTWSIYEDGHMIFEPTTGETGTLGEWNWDSSPWFAYRSEIKSVKFQGEVLASRCWYMFYECSNLTTIDFSGFNTANVRDMADMFAFCTSLQSLDLSSFNTANVQSLASMFESCQNLATLKLSNDFVLNEEVNKTYLFENCGTEADELSIYYVIDESIKNALLDGTNLGELDAWGKVNFVPSAIVKDGVPFNVTYRWAWDIPAENVVFTRQFTAEKPASAMLPFEVEASNISGATFYEFKGVKYENNEWVAIMQDVSTVQEYTPYVVITSGTGITFTGDNIIFQSTEVVNGKMTQTDAETGWTFVALNEFKRWEAGDVEIGKAYGFAGKNKDYDDYSVAKGEFVKIAAGASAKPGRCYLVKNDGEPLAAKGMTRASAADELPSTIKVRFISGSANGIGTLNTETGEFSIEGWYDLNGNKIEQPSKGGVYINNNKKVMVK